MHSVISLQDLKKQYLSLQKEIDSAMHTVILEQAFIGGTYVEKFEKAFADYFGTRHAIGVNSGTDAITLALWALGIKKGDEVITTAFSFIATPAAISLLGATPVFVDISPETFTIDPADVERKITKRTRAILPVHLYGHLSDMGAINILAKKYKLFVVEDACQAIGATWKKEKAGNLSDIGCFSFHPSKNLGAYGDAGALVTNRTDVAKKIQMLRNHGSLQQYENKTVGISSRLDGIQAAILLVKLKHLAVWNKKRRLLARAYTKQLKNEFIILPREEEGYHHVYNNYTIRVTHNKRDSLRAYLKRKHIETGIYYPTPLHLQEALASLRYKHGDFPIAERASKEVLSLPIHPEMELKDIDYISECIHSFV
jgi:dTDP-4-amino-4,6-dideoxygalactose transaminase